MRSVTSIVYAYLVRPAQLKFHIRSVRRVCINVLSPSLTRRTSWAWATCPVAPSKACRIRISADGIVVVGESAAVHGTEAFRWTLSGGIVGLGDLPGPEHRQPFLRRVG